MRQPCSRLLSVATTDLLQGAEGVAKQLSEGMRQPCWRQVSVATADLFMAAEGVA